MTTEPADALTRLDGYPFEARYSQGARTEAVRLADLAKEAYAYFTHLFWRVAETHGLLSHPQRLD